MCFDDEDYFWMNLLLMILVICYFVVEGVPYA